YVYVAPNGAIMDRAAILGIVGDPSYGLTDGAHTEMIVVGLLSLMAGAIAWMDPVGSKMSDDDDPFGPPASQNGSAAIVVLGIAICYLGRRVWRASYRDTAV
ncbi:MAG TPA: hypothetical protein VGP80_10100, partial [Gemmatimonadales bacterium]|nr:hypothetical protein [Gemmatimonadales bacterium]